MEPEQKRHPLLKILLWDVSEFVKGALIALVVFAILFVILNYFNIISLSIIYKPLALLPRQSAGLPAKTVIRNFSSLPSPSPTPTL